MSPDDPRHGSPAGAMKHWRDGEKPCQPCSAAASRARAERELATLSGQSRTVELGQEAWLIARDTPRGELAQQIGMTHERILRYVKGGPQMRVYRGTRDRILTAKPTWTPLGLQRRLRALSALGWSIKEQAKRTEISATALYGIRASIRGHVWGTSAAGILALYDELSMRIPPSGASATEARNEAQRKGWLPPLAWDDIDRDPAPMIGSNQRHNNDVDHAVVERVLAGENLPTSRAEKDEIVRRWKARGWPLNDLERRFGWKVERYGREGDAA